MRIYYPKSAKTEAPDSGDENEGKSHDDFVQADKAKLIDDNNSDK